MITRRTIIGKAAAALAASATGSPLGGQTSAESDGRQFFLRLLKASNDSVGRLLQDPQARPARGLGRGANIAALAAAYCAPESSYYKSENLIPPMENASAAFLAAQHPDGTLD